MSDGSSGSLQFFCMVLQEKNQFAGLNLPQFDLFQCIYCQGFHRT